MTRNELIARARAEKCWDLIVIGGGATGLGTAVDAAARGYRTLLVEAHDFAKGTSSRSTKLVHGGVRYLAQLRLGLVHEALHERGLLHRNAPHLVSVLPFLVPAYSRWDVPFYGLGLKLYDILAGQLGLGRSRTVSRTEAIQHAPTLEPAGLRGGLLYFDGQFDDSRLAVALVRTLLEQGGTALNYVVVRRLIKEAGRVAGVEVQDIETGETFALSARGVINATGVYADEIRQMDDRSARSIIAPSQGAHLVLSRDFLPGDSAIMVPKTDDGRVMFAIPWHDHVIVGTTDTAVCSLPIEPRPLPEEIDFLLRHAARYLTRDPRPSDVLSVFAGLRPLVSSSPSDRTASLSRSHKLLVSPSGLVTITGGKWTTYRRMAADTVTRAAEIAGLPPRACTTATLHLHGWSESPPAGELALYGSDAPALERLMAEQPCGSEPIHDRLPYRLGEVVWAARYELARTVEDVLARRTRALFLDARASKESAPRIAATLASELGCDTAWQAAQVEHFSAIADRYLIDS